MTKHRPDPAGFAVGFVGWRSRAAVPKTVAVPQDVGLQHTSPTIFSGNMLSRARFTIRSRVPPDERLESSARPQAEQVKS